MAELPRNQIIQGDSLTVLKTLPDEFVDCCITSPPYWGLRDYGIKNQLGLEPTPEEYVAKMVEIFREVRRLLKKEGTLWLNLGDSYSGSNSTKDAVINPNSLSAKAGCTLGGVSTARGVVNGLKPKDLCGIPWRVAFALQADGWYLRQDIIWHKPNPMPESVTDRCTKAHEYVFLLSKSQHYYYDNEAIKEEVTPGIRKAGLKKDFDLDGLDATKGGFAKNDISYSSRNRRSVWTITTKPFSEAHFATFPPDLIEPMIKAGTQKSGIVFDPFMGSGTTALVARQLGRDYLGIELNPEYIKIAERRLISNDEPILMNTIKSIQEGKQKVLI